MIRCYGMMGGIRRTIELFERNPNDISTNNCMMYVFGLDIINE